MRASGSADHHSINRVRRISEGLGERRVALAISTLHIVSTASIDRLDDTADAELTVARGIVEMDGANTTKTNDNNVN